jgi:hypothetical protein
MFGQWNLGVLAILSNVFSGTRSLTPLCDHIDITRRAVGRLWNVGEGVSRHSIH